MKKAFSCVQALLCLCLSLFYHSTIARPLAVGDVVPAYTIPHILQYPNASARLSDFKDQLLLLDFMNTRCGICISHLRRMDTFQHQFAGRLQFFSVSPETVPAVQSFLQKPFQGKKFTTAFIAKDSVLKSWFPHIYVSHLVWIYKGKVVGITTPDEVTARNIESVLHNETVRLRPKRDFGRYDPSYPFLTANPAMTLPIPETGIQSYSTLFQHLDGYSYDATEFRDTINNYLRTTYINQDIRALYEVALGLSDILPEAFTKLYVRDSTVFYRQINDLDVDWHHRSSRTYQAVYPLTYPDSLVKKKMVADLDFYLGYQGRRQTETVRCIVLRAAPALRDTAWRGEGRSAQLDNVVYQRNRLKGNLPYLNEVPNSKSIFLPMPTNLKELSLPALQAYLRPFGYTLTEEQHEVTFLVISDGSYDTTGKRL